MKAIIDFEVAVFVSEFNLETVLNRTMTLIDNGREHTSCFVHMPVAQKIVKERGQVAVSSYQDHIRMNMYKQKKLCPLRTELDLSVAVQAY
jgi:hypothetical protein